MNNFVAKGRERKRGERSSACINSFQGQKQLWAQVSRLSQAGFPGSSSLLPQASAYRPPRDGTKKDRNTTIPGYIRGNKPPGDKSDSSSLEGRPQLQPVLSLLGKT